MSFGKFIGQEDIKRRLSLIINGQSGGSFLFTGPEGIGKHTIAKDFAKALVCENPTSSGACCTCKCCTYYDAHTLPDVVILDGENPNIKVSEVRTQIISDSGIAPQIAKRKVYLIDCDRLNEEGQNAILKSVEEPPLNSAFILMSADKSKLLPTIISRVIEFKVGFYSNEDIRTIVKDNAPDIDGVTLDTIVDFASGIPGKAIAMVSDDEFIEYKDKMLNLIINMPETSYTDILYREYSYFEENKERIRDLLLFMLWVLGDISSLLKVPNTESIKYKDKRDIIYSFVKKNEYLTTARIASASDAITEFIKGLGVNVSFESACCSMLLKIRKELVR